MKKTRGPYKLPVILWDEDVQAKNGQSIVLKHTALIKHVVVLVLLLMTSDSEWAHCLGGVSELLGNM